jgi:hypothetical protein
MMRCPPGRCATPDTMLVWPRIFLWGVIADIFVIPAAGEDMVDVQRSIKGILVYMREQFFEYLD